MKQLLALSVGLFFMSAAWSQDKSKSIHVVDSSKKVLQVEASCGQCKFGLKDKGCDLAVRIDGKAYFVDGTSIDDHGDAHGAEGFCMAIRKAEVQGKIKDGRFKATYFKLLPKVEALKTE
ncbi:MAG: hypothetical protein HOP10_05380 [Chitinophagaceae bacterium]|nr:hypothetical protein [Chitinophagaceae bacterium]